MNAQTTANNETHGWIFYDAGCSLCVRAAARVNRLLERRGFRLLPLQTPGTAERLCIQPGELLTEMSLLTPSGQRLGGADALVEIARHIWWARPLVVLARLPGAMPFLRGLYARLAANRHCLNGVCKPHRPRKIKRVFFELP